VSTADDATRLVTLPVAAVVVDTGLPHLDRVFEYAVPAELSDAAQPGCRVRVRFAGRDLDGFVVQRRPYAEHPGRLAAVRRVVSSEPVLTPEILTLCRAVADHHAGVLGDVLRLAVPKRHAAAERALDKSGPPTLAMIPAPEPWPWSAYPAGEALLRRIAAGEAPAAAWLALPGRAPEEDWPRALAVAAATTVAGGRGALVVVPDHRDVDRVDAELGALLGPGQHVRLTADQGPQARYTVWLKVLRGHVRCVVGTRAAAFAPLHHLGLVAWWDDGDDLLEEPRAPYPHVREVLRLRATQSGAALLTGGFARSVAVQQLVEDGVLMPVQARADALRAAAPRVHVAGDDLDRSGPAALARLPPLAWRTAKAALEHGPVLVQVPRRGYLPALACQHCREPARCPRCHGPMGMPEGLSVPTCRWCGATYGTEGFVCPECEGRELRSTVVGAHRTAEELGRAFPGVPVRTSGSGEVLASVDRQPALVIATPGAEPVADGGYSATLLLDGWSLLDRSGLDAAMEALRRWLGAAALTRPATDGGSVVLAGTPTHTTIPAVEALVRWDPVWLASRELAERVELALPPAVTMAQVVGPRGPLVAAVEGASLPTSVERLGPLPFRGPSPTAGPPLAQVLLRVPRRQHDDLAHHLAALRAERSARKEVESVSVRMDLADGQS
jgi:primosomal protein N' (replication factor Y) (superfamily II helicase)